MKPRTTSLARQNGRASRKFEYDVCLSFAGEDRTYVETVAIELSTKGCRVFYDKYEVANLWGKDLYTHLDYVYGGAARYCVLFVSKHYAKKLWTAHERQSAQSRAFLENSDYILPACFDDTEIPGRRADLGPAIFETRSELDRPAAAA